MGEVVWVFVLIGIMFSIIKILRLASKEDREKKS